MRILEFYFATNFKSPLIFYTVKKSQNEFVETSAPSIEERLFGLPISLTLTGLSWSGGNPLQSTKIKISKRKHFAASLVGPYTSYSSKFMRSPNFD